jgi:hypothetical protein
MLLRCFLPFMASFRILPAPALCLTTPACPLAGLPAAISARSGCSPHQGRGLLPSWASVNLEALLPTVSASFPSQFHPLLTLAPLLAFVLFRVSPGMPWVLYRRLLAFDLPPPFGVLRPLRVLLHPGRSLRSSRLEFGAPPLLRFGPCDTHSLFSSSVSWVMVSPQARRHVTVSPATFFGPG